MWSSESALGYAETASHRTDLERTTFAPRQNWRRRSQAERAADRPERRRICSLERSSNLRTSARFLKAQKKPEHVEAPAIQTKGSLAAYETTPIREVAKRTESVCRVSTAPTRGRCGCARKFSVDESRTRRRAGGKSVHADRLVLGHCDRRGLSQLFPLFSPEQSLIGNAY